MHLHSFSWGYVTWGSMPHTKGQPVVCEVILPHLPRLLLLSKSWIVIKKYLILFWLTQFELSTFISVVNPILYNV
jgi:hypothetical protein